MKIIQFVFLIFLLYSCKEENAYRPYKMDYILMDLELAFYEEDNDQLMKLAGELNDQCKEYYNQNPGDTYEESQLYQYLNAIVNTNFDKREKEIMPLIKGEYLEEIYFPSSKSAFLPALWNSGDAMWAVIGTATDPMLDLYEWNEFMEQVDALRKNKEILLAYDIDLELMQFNNKKYVDHASKFNPWMESIDQFFRVISNEEKNLNDIKSAANNMKRTYNQYIMWFTKEDNRGNIS